MIGNSAEGRVRVGMCSPNTLALCCSNEIGPSQKKASCAN